MDDEDENYPDPEGSYKRNHTEQLETNNMFTYDVEDPICTDKRKKLITCYNNMDYFLKNRKDTTGEQGE